MKELSVKKIFVNILEYFIKYSLGAGIIILPILYSIFEDVFLIVLILYIFLIFVFGVICTLEDIIEKFQNKDKEIDREKNKLQTQYDELTRKLNIENENLKNKYKEASVNLSNKYTILLKKFEDEKQKFYKIVEDEKIYKPYLAEMFARYKYEMDCIVAQSLENKKRPALKSAEDVRRFAKENKELQRKLKIKENQMIVYESLFPWLEEFKEIPEEEINVIVKKEESEGYERVKDFLSPEEYNKLDDCKKYQLWLDRYRAKNKSNWEVGREFERFVGYEYEMQGYKLIYNGAIEGLEDMGRDLIAKKGKELLVIQCKNWSNNKIIHEKHIFQLYGTMVLKKLEEPDKQIKGIFICTNSLSDTAKAVAKQLNINVMENYEYNRNYPCIKCNISRKDGTKIYHLPFDQQYDRINIEVDKGEQYVSTVEEAEKLGFRKAMKHIN